jgi:hypothetical protein
MNHKLLIVSLLTVALLPLAGVQAQKSESAGSIHIVGKIVMAGGQLPWDPVPIVIRCDGQTRAYSFADRNGQFNLEPPGKRGGREFARPQARESRGV